MIKAAGRISTFDLFRLEVEKQARLLQDGLIALQVNQQPEQALPILLQAVHGLLEAARMVDNDAVFALAQSMEDCFLATQSYALPLQAHHIELLLNGVEQLVAVSTQHGDPRILEYLAGRIRTIGLSQYDVESATNSRVSAEATENAALDDLLRLAGEVETESRRLEPAVNALWRIKQQQFEMMGLIDRLNEHLLSHKGDAYSRVMAAELHTQASHCRQLLSERILELNACDRHMHTLGKQLYNAASMACMRPFSELTSGFPHQVRELARQLGKRVELQMEGLDTPLDREILRQLETPIQLLLRNALQHGIESPEERHQSGKPRLATIQLRALQRSGMLLVQVVDDGRGFNLEEVRAHLVCNDLIEVTTAAYLSDTALLEFLFRPGLSGGLGGTFGEGTGLDTVCSSVQKLRGTLHASSEPGKRTCIELQLPLTLSSLRALVVDISGDAYAIPFAQIERTLKLEPEQVESQHGRKYFLLDGQPVCLVSAAQLFAHGHAGSTGEPFAVLVLGEGRRRAGLVVGHFIGEQRLMVQDLDPRLGTLEDISAAGVLENGDPCLIVDVDALLHRIHSAPASR